MSEMIEDLSNRVLKRAKSAKKSIHGMYIEDEVWTRLTEAAQAKGITPTALVREILRAAFNMSD